MEESESAPRVRVPLYLQDDQIEVVRAWEVFEIELRTDHRIFISPRQI